MSKPDKIIAEKFIGTTAPQVIKGFNEKDAILYALGIGFNQDPLKADDFKYTCEFNDEFTPFPTLAATIFFPSYYAYMIQSPAFPEFSPFMILHAEQKITLHSKLQTGVDYIHKPQIIDVVDKGKMALVTGIMKSYKPTDSGQPILVYENQTSLLIKGLGGFGYKGTGKRSSMPKKPDRNPDKILKGKTYQNQAFVYRLTGDNNMLHVDPSISALQKFERPIMHGLASMGVVGKVIIQQLLGNEPWRLKSYHARFLGHVYPGQSFDIQIWNQSPTIILVNVKTVERGTTAFFAKIELTPSPKI